MIKKKEKFDVTTYTHQLTDNAVDDAGKEAYATFTREEIEVSNDNLIPFHATDRVVVKRTIEEVDVDDPTCQNGDEPTPTPGEPKIVGADNTSVKQGLGFDLMAGVKAYDGDGNEIPFTVTPDTLDKCDIGPQSFTYSAEGVTKVRTIEVTAIADPTISGLTPLEVEVGEEFDPLAGVSAVDGNGKSVEVTYEQPSEYPYTMCTIGAGTIPALENGDTYNLSVDIDWLKTPPTNVTGSFYGENVVYKGQPLTSPLGEFGTNGNTWDFIFDDAYAFESMTIGGNEVSAVCYGDGMGELSWDSLRFEATGEQ